MKLGGECLDAARRYVALGWSVVPLHTPDPEGCTCWKARACRMPGKHPRVNWGDAARAGRRASDADVCAWWRRWPDANVGIVTGTVSGLAVLDVDRRSGGLDTLHELDARGLWAPDDNPLGATGGGGLHHYVALAAPLRTCAPFEGIEVKADGGIATAAPSLHQSGRRYEWLRPPETHALPPMPRWLRRCADHYLTRRPDAAPPPAPADAATDGVLAAVQSAGLYLRRHRRQGWHYLNCPWADEHSNGDPEALLIEPGAVGSERRGWGYVCQHAHCADRHLGALLDHLGIARRRA